MFSKYKINLKFAVIKENKCKGNSWQTVKTNIDLETESDQL